jgi:hypothetical protein|tara:strand:+ start:1324 stop:1644 length:321 start_codon:yes stop_codon:yes gene_type:complete
MKYFYRLQNSEGKGPYTAGSFWKGVGWNTTKHLPKHGNPQPNEDYKIMHIELENDHIFGFLTLNMLQRWFRPEEIKKLHKEGFTIVRIKGTEVASSQYQSIFKKIA